MAILEHNDIINLYDRYIAVVNFINTINNGYPAGQLIKQVQIPSSLTQSIAYHFLINNPNHIELDEITNGQLIEGNNRTYDLIINSTPPINIEIKATGTNEFQRFRPQALTANFVLWLNFQLNNNTYDIAIFNPNILVVNNLVNNHGEVDINWDTIIIIPNVLVIRDQIV